MDTTKHTEERKKGLEARDKQDNDKMKRKKKRCKKI